jgi:hypothetical protein
MVIHNMTLTIWQMFLRFVDFWETYKPELIDQEIHLYSDTLRGSRYNRFSL